MCFQFLRAPVSTIRERLDPAFGAFSSGETGFTIAAISVYNEIWARDLARRAGRGDTVFDLLTYLDDKWLRIIFLLPVHDRDWYER